MTRWPIVICLGCLAAMIVGGCTAGDDGAPREPAFRVRNTARLQATRDTPEGYQAAAAAFVESVARSPDGPERLGDLVNLARCLTLGGQPEDARKVLAEARKSVPSGAGIPADILYIEGLVLKALKDYPESARRFRDVLARDPGVEAAWYQLGTVLLLGGSHEEAIGALEKLIELNPQHLPAHYKTSMAYRALGRTEKADEQMARFLELRKRAGQEATEDSAYERCKYTRVTLTPPSGVAMEPPALPLDFEDATEAAGLGGNDASGIAVLDFDRDGDPDLYLVRRGANKLLRNDRGRFVDVTELSDAADPGDGIGAEPADFNNDGILDIFVVNTGPCALLKGLGEGVFQPLPTSGLALTGVRGARWADYDHDGDLDLVALETPDGGGGPQAVIHRNNGDETFSPQEGLLPGAVPGTHIAMADLDRGNDIDFLVATPDGPVAAFLNLRTGPFRREAIEGLSGHELVGAADLNGDGELDVVGAPSASAPLRIGWNGGAVGSGKIPGFRVETMAGVESPGRTRSLSLCDLDNDGDVDVLLGAEKGLAFYRNRMGKLEQTNLGGLQAQGGGLVSFVTAVDVDGDGRLDLLLGREGGRVVLLRNVSRESYPAVTVRPVGSRDNRDGIGAHIELFAGARYQRRLVDANGGARFGLGDAGLEALDGFEILWPNGIEQPLLREELKWDSWRAQDVTQKRGLTVSCPFLYAHDGRGYRFLTDVVGIAPLDEWLPAGAPSRLDPEEYVRIPSEALEESGGALRLVITEELRETTYLDRVRLIRVTHPRGTLVHADESTRQGDVEPLKVWAFASRDVLPPRRVEGEGGRSFTALAAARDRIYFHPYPDAPTQWAGWVPSHSFEIEAPPVPPGPSALLLLEGRIYWPDSSVTFALSQHGRAWPPPRLEGLDALGRASPLIDDIGFPCGMDRTMLLPIPQAPPRLRLVSSHRFLWDRIAFVRRAASAVLESDGPAALDLGADSMTIVRETLPLRAAELRYHGLSRVAGDMERNEQTYDFDVTTPPGLFQSPVGRATRYGDVRELVGEPDSSVVVLVPGDACFFEFDAGRRDDARDATFFLQVTGWAKESNFHNPTGRSIEPLPFHGMDGYPPRTDGPPRPDELTRRIGGL